MKQIKQIICAYFLLASIIANAQNSVIEFFQFGHEMMKENKINNVSNTLQSKGYKMQGIGDNVIQAKSRTADIRLASRNINSQQLDTMRMELRMSTSVTSLTIMMKALGYYFIKDHNEFSSWQNGEIKVAVFNPYNYKNYKVGFVFVREPQRPTTSSPVREYGKNITVNGVSFNMIRINGGVFTMGNPNKNSTAKPTHQVTLTTFFIGETEVTQELWEAVMGKNLSFYKNPKRPVEKVSWDDCQRFINRLNTLTGYHFRLPTEAEWEYAARGGKKSKGFQFAGGNNLTEIAWYKSNRSYEVGTKKPNELGLFDMSGNVWEWCQDWYGPYNSGKQKNPTGPSSGKEKICRGGCWISYDSNCHVAYRNYFKPSYRCNLLGFRLAM